MRVLLADDRKEDLKILESVLSSFESVQIVGKLTELSKLEGCLRNAIPDVVFLDILFPERSGLELVEQIRRSGSEVVLVTAFEQYAIEAFRLRVRDYLLKPLRLERVGQTVELLRETLMRERTMGVDEVSLPVQGVWRRLLLARVDGFQAKGNYTLIWDREEGPLLCRMPLYRVLQRLPAGHGFRQFSRQQAVPLRRIQSLLGVANGRIKVKLDNGEELYGSKRRSIELRRELESLFGKRLN